VTDIIKNTDQKIRLHGFNNLTKTLSFNIYDISYANSPSQIEQYMQYIDEEYNSARLTEILQNVAHIIGANILNIANADYDPLGASVTMLISEELPAMDGVTDAQSPGPTPEAVVAHLDKSHLTVHTYPEGHPDHGICSFRADIDVSTCGMISPLKALNFLIHSFDSDIVIMDYRVRGFTRELSSNKIFIDHPITSIQNYIDKETKENYQMIDVNIYGENIFHTKMMLKEFELENYLFDKNPEALTPDQSNSIEIRLRQEMNEIYAGKNI
jgi:S-adenosylmethionine decarboxylase